MSVGAKFIDWYSHFDLPLSGEARIFATILDIRYH